MKKNLKGRYSGNSRGNNICLKHKYSSRHPGLCPICRQPLESLGKSWRIAKDGEFGKLERDIDPKFLRIPKSLREKN